MNWKVPFGRLTCVSQPNRRSTQIVGPPCRAPNDKLLSLGPRHMPRLPRLAVGTLAPGAGPAPGVWALMAALRLRDCSVQPFLAQACFQPHLGGAGLSGRLPRHLDSWLMSEAVCRELFAHGASGCDLALVLGEFDAGAASQRCAAVVGSSLTALCQWLDLPRIVVLDAATMNDCALPTKPAEVDAVLIYGSAADATMERRRTQVETLWGAPVLGALEIPDALAKALADAPLGTTPAAETVRALAACAEGAIAWDRLWTLAGRRPISNSPVQLFAPHEARLGGVRVAIAFDDAICCYFPDVLELLELRGASVRDFSPLKDDRLPKGTDVVYLGCGRPEQFARQLADNDCLKLALREHFVAGRRIYAEGGAAAILAETLQTAGGEQHAMAGLLPLTLRCDGAALPTLPIETTLSRDCWLGPRGTALRGYLNSTWTFSGPDDIQSLRLTDDEQPLLWGYGEAIVSRLHLNFAALPGALGRLVAPTGRSALAPAIIS